MLCRSLRGAMAYLPRGCLRPPSTSSAAPRHGPGGRRWPPATSSLRGRGGSLVDPRSLEGQDSAGGPHSSHVVDGSDRRRGAVYRPVRGCPASEVLPALDARFPAETMRQADASRSPLSRPSIDLPPPTITLDSNSCAKICGVVSYERAPKRCPNGHRLGPHRVVVGWTPCTCPTALRPSGATGHRTYLCIVCEAEIFVPPHTGPLFSGVRWPPRQTQEQPRPDSGGE